jgi:hypothetical protein
MRKLFSTTDLHPRDRFDYWHDVACREITMHDSVPENRLAFEAELQTGSLAEIQFLNVKSSPTQVAHATRHIGRATDDELLVCRQLSGQVMFEQNGREVMLEAGDVTLLDPLLPITGSFSAPQDLLVLKVPRLALEARVGKSSQMVACAIKASEAEGGLTSSFLAMLPGYADRMQPPAAETVSTQAFVEEVAAWQRDRNQNHAKADWHFTTENGFQTPAVANISTRTAAGVWKPPRDETAGRGTY